MIASMPWWAWIWVVAMVGATIGGVIADREVRAPLWYTVLGAVTGLACPTFVLDYHGVVELGYPVWVPLATLVVLCAVMARDVWVMAGTDEASSRELIVGTLITLVVFAPAIVLGLLGATPAAS